jgi:protease-4
MLWVLFRNLWVGVASVLVFPLRALRYSGRPTVVRFLLKGSPPFREGLAARRPFWKKVDAAQVRSLELLNKQCERLGADARVKSVVFEVEGFVASSAQRQLVVEIISNLRAAGKTVWGYAIHGDTAEYEVLSACERIAMAPAGRLELTGFAAEAFTLGSFLKKWGVRAQFVRRGEHKTAPELFTHEQVSDIQKKTLETLLEERYQTLVQALATGRGFSLEEARAKIDAGPYSARRAFAEKLVDELRNPVEFAHHLLADEHAVEIPNIDDWKATRLVRADVWKPVRRKPGVFVVPVNGMISHGAGGGLPLGPTVAGSEGVVRLLRRAAEDRRCQAVVLHINSPGGSALGSELILEEVKRLAAKKPVVAWFEKVAASGGYMAALGAQEIWSAPLAIVGSIGVFAGKFEVSELLQRLGVSHSLITRGRNAAIFSMSKAFSPTEEAALEADVGETYEVFLEQVASARKMSRDDVHARAEGRIYSGTAALKAGLLDRVGPFEDAARRALELANIRSRDFDVRGGGLRKMALPGLSFLQQLQSEHLWALWHPSWKWE